MKIKLLLLSTMFLALFSCTEYEYIEREKLQLEVAKQQLIPYQKGQKINFVHSKGYAFDFTVAVDTIIWRNNKNMYDRTVKSYYDSFQVRTVKLISDYPDFSIWLSVTAEPNRNWLQVEMNDLNALIPVYENYKLIPDTVYGQSKLHETILINGKTYNNVIETQLRSGKSGEPNRSLLINEQGIIQIKFSDNEIFSINN